MINSFENYIKSGKVKRKTPDIEEAKSLLSKAEERLQYIKIRRLTNSFAKFILEDAYEAMREATQSLMSIKGYKPYSHEATISFIKEFFNDDFTEQEIFLFDYFRKLRNESIYKATIILKQEAKSLFNFCKKIFN